MKKLLLLIMLIGVLGDITTTYIGFTKWGCGIERNPITRATCFTCGYLPGVVVGGIWEFTILYLFFKLYEAKAHPTIRYYFMTIVSLLPYVAVINNTLFLLTH